MHDDDDDLLYLFEKLIELIGYRAAAILMRHLVPYRYPHLVPRVHERAPASDVVTEIRALRREVGRLGDTIRDLTAPRPV